MTLWKAEKTANGEGDQVSVEALIGKKPSVFGLFGGASIAEMIAALENTYKHVRIRG